MEYRPGNIRDQHHLVGMDERPEGDGPLVGRDGSPDFGIPEIHPPPGRHRQL